MTAPRRGGAAEAPQLRSAGGVVLMAEGDKVRIAVMRSRHGTWVLPKGGIEEGESPEEAARREIEEETGATGATLVAPLGTTQHQFHMSGQRVLKRVEWFLFSAPTGTEVGARPEQGSLDCGWFTPKQALSVLSHASQRRIVRRALAAQRGDR